MISPLLIKKSFIKSPTVPTGLPDQEQIIWTTNTQGEALKNKYTKNNICS
jgi:hypothetical protein